ncbi:MAG: hypothetical protein Q9195_009548 [Heterodermia aff. obscurata]
MEAIAAAASIAGIITLAAQAIEGLQSLHAFFVDISTASKTVSSLLRDINSLIAVLHNIDGVLHQVERQRKNQNFAQLDIKVDDCSKDVKLWLETAKDLRPGGEKGGRAWVRRARLAVKGEVVDRIREEIGRHRQALCLSLEVFGRTIDLHTSEQLHQMRGQFDDALTTSLSNHGAHEETLRRIEQYSITSMRSTAHSIKSMDSIRTELSRLEAMITISQTASTSRIEQFGEDPMVGSSQNDARPVATQRTEHESSTEAQQGIFSGETLEPATSQHSRNGSSSSSKYSSKAGSAVHGGNRGETDARTNPTDFQRLVKEQESITKRFSEISNGHESALLYAQFSRNTSPSRMTRKESSGRPPNLDFAFEDLDISSTEDVLDAQSPFLNRPSRSKQVPESQEARFTKNDRKSIYGIMEQSLAAVYSPIVAEYVSLQTLVIMCEGHLKILEERPSIFLNSTTLGANHDAVNAQPHVRRLHDRLDILQEAVDSSARECLEAGYSIPDLDKMSFSISGYRPEQEKTRLNTTFSERDLEPKDDGTDDTPGDESDAYFSSTE